VFDVWGFQFDSQHVMGFHTDASHPITMTVNGQSSSDFGNLLLAPNQDIIVTADQAAPDIQFSAAAFTVAENGGSATITVTRTDSATSRITFAASNGTGLAGVNYTPTSATVTFAAGETSKTFTVPVLDDNVVNGDTTVNLTLTSPDSLAVVSRAVLTIK